MLLSRVAQPLQYRISTRKAWGPPCRKEQITRDPKFRNCVKVPKRLQVRKAALEQIAEAVAEACGCEEAYGFLPCSSSLGGSIALTLGYGYLTLKGAGLLGGGSELLLEVLNPGLIGGLLLPVLGALPDSLIILVSGLGGSREIAAEQVALGVGTLAGSTLLLLTMALGGSIVLGRCDLDSEGTAINKTLTRESDWYTTGVTVDSGTRMNAAIMAASSLLYLIVQIPALLGDKEDQLVSLIGACACFATLLAYMFYQVVNPELQQRKMEAARGKLYRLYLMQSMGGGRLLAGMEAADPQQLGELFDQLDKNKSGAIEEEEVEGLLVGLSLSLPGSADDASAVTTYMSREMDLDKNNKITKEEFVEVVSRWMTERRAAQAARFRRSLSSAGMDQDAASEISALQRTLTTYDKENSGDEELEEAGLEAHGGNEAPPTPQQIIGKAVAMLLAGTFVCAFMSDPLVDALGTLSKTSGVPAFFVAFALTPLASNASELFSSLQFAMAKRNKSISLTFSQVYGAVTMNNTLCLGLFLLVVRFQQLPWVYTTEVAVMVGATAALGILGSQKSTWQSWQGLAVMGVYPLAVALVYLGDYVFMWDG